MKFSTFINSYFWQSIILLLLGGLLNSCQNEPSVKKYVQRLCACYSADTKASLQLRSGQINQATYDQLMVACMGEDDPLQQLEKDPQKLLEFKAAFLDSLQTTCPDVARRLGY